MQNIMNTLRRYIGYTNRQEAHVSELSHDVLHNSVFKRKRMCGGHVKYILFTTIQHPTNTQTLHNHILQRRHSVIVRLKHLQPVNRNRWHLSSKMSLQFTITTVNLLRILIRSFLLLLLHPWLVPSSGVAGIADQLLPPFCPVCCVGLFQPRLSHILGLTSHFFFSLVAFFSPYTTLSFSSHGRTTSVVFL